MQWEASVDFPSAMCFTSVVSVSVKTHKNAVIISKEDQEEHEKDLNSNQSRQLNSRAIDEISCKPEQDVAHF